MESAEDSLMERTADRPILAATAAPTGTHIRSSARPWRLGPTLLSSRYSSIWLHPRDAHHLSSYLHASQKGALDFYLCGGALGAIPPLIGASAVQSPVGLSGWLLFAVLFAWQIPHFMAISWLYKKDYIRGNFAMLSRDDASGKAVSLHAVLFAGILLLICLIPIFMGHAHWMYAVLAPLLAGWLLYEASFLQKPHHTQQVKRLFFLYLTVFTILYVCIFAWDHKLSTHMARQNLDFSLCAHFVQPSTHSRNSCGYRGTGILRMQHHAETIGLRPQRSRLSNAVRCDDADAVCCHRALHRRGGRDGLHCVALPPQEGEDPNAIPDQSHGNPLIEVGLIVLSASMLVIIGIPTLKGIAYMKNDPVEEYEGEAIEIIVTGYQWWWNFEYPELGIKTSNEFSIPTGRPIKLVLKAADVIHSFWVPKLAGKTDLIPGQINRMWIEADEPGMYWGQCAEFCGDSHAYMLFRTISLEPDKFDEWVEHQKSAPVEPESTLAHTGKALFTEKGCIGCHMVGKVGGLAGPDLTHFGSRATLAAGWKANTLENLKEWIQYPEKVKPGNLMYLGVGTHGGH